MDKSLSPRDAADRLGITTDTLRRWEREGKIECQRTPGGQRRYRESDVTDLLVNPPTQRAVQHAPAEDRQSEALDSGFVAEDLENATEKHNTSAGSEWDRRVNQERAELEVTKLRREREAMLREDADLEKARVRSEAIAEKDALAAQALQEKNALARQAEKERLERLRRHGRNLSLFAPSEYQAKVTRDLECFVNSAQFPVTLDEILAYQFLVARVEKLLKPWRDANEAKKREAARENERRHKMHIGMMHATATIVSWERDAARRARIEVQEALEEEVDYNWSTTDVYDLVDELLEEFTE